MSEDSVGTGPTGCITTPLDSHGTHGGAARPGGHGSLGGAARPEGRGSFPRGGSLSRRRRLALWFEQTRRPGLVLIGVVLLLYAPFLGGDFTLDDLRGLRVFGEYHRGERPTLGVYRFLPGGAANVADRDAGWYFWWVTEELRYQHFRPLTERLLYAQYLLFGEHAVGFRVVSLALYIAGILLVFRLLQAIGPTPRVARWAALIFAVLAGHAVPVVFISAQCDVLALVLAAAALLSIAAFVCAGGAQHLTTAVVGYAAGLFAKEMVLPVAALPICLGLIFCDAPGARRRSFLAAASLIVVGLIWFSFYVAGGYGSNGLIMLDPLHTPWAYVRALPVRALLLLAALVIPVNPFLFQFNEGWEPELVVYGVIGAAVLAALAVMYYRRHRADRSVMPMALWAVLFLPVLVCTPPDDRVMILPSIALAHLAALWMVRAPCGTGVSPVSTDTGRMPAPHEAGDASAAPPLEEPRPEGRGSPVRGLPFVWFVVVQAAIVPLIACSVQFMENEAQDHLRLMLSFFEPAPAFPAQPTGLKAEARRDHIFMLNTARGFEVLFIQDRLSRVQPGGPTRVSVLSDVARPHVTVVDAHTIRLNSTSAPFFSSYLGRLGTARERPWRQGDAIRLPEFDARITRVEGGAVTEMEFRFAQPINSDSYRFVWSDPFGEPKAVELNGG
jgi:hypothetical protein